MKLVFLCTALLAVQLCSSQRINYQPWNNQPNVEQCSNMPRPNEYNRYDNQLRYDYPPVRDFSQTKYFNSCSCILSRFPDTPSGYYYITTGPDSYRKVYCEMERTICGEKGWEKFYYLNLPENRNQDCPDSFVKTTYKTSNRRDKPFCEKAVSVDNCTKAYFPLQGRQYYEVCAKVSGYQYGTPSAFYPFDVENAKFFLDGIQFMYGKKERHLWSYVVGAHRDFKENKTPLRELCPDASPKYKWTIPYYLGNNYYCDSGLYEYSNTKDTTKLHYENRLWEGKNCEYPNSSCKRSGQPWFYTKLPTNMEDYIEIRSCYINKDTDVKFDNLEIYLR